MVPPEPLTPSAAYAPLEKNPAGALPAAQPSALTVRDNVQQLKKRQKSRFVRLKKNV